LSKILVFVNFQVSQTAATNNLGVVNLVRDSTNIGGGVVVGSRSSGISNVRVSGTSDASTVAFNFLDSPATTSATTYKCQILSQSATQTVGRAGVDADSVQTGRTGSTITVMEVAA
jgi:hypothetical protein